VTRWLAFSVVVSLAGCGSSPFVQASYVRERPRRSHAPMSTARELPAGRPFAPSPITETAEAFADLALAAIEARPLPPSPIPTAGPITSNVDWRDGVTSLNELSVIAVAFEVDLVLKRGVPAEDAEGVARWGELRAVIAVSRNGLRIVELRPGEMRDDATDRAAPAGLEGLVPLTRDLLSRLRAGDLSIYELTEDDRRLLANDVAWARIQHDRPHHGRLREIQEMLASLPHEPLGYRLDDVSILARDGQNRLYALSLEVDPHGDTFALVTEPLVTVRRLWPRE
jgi:hypothetical protein